MLLKDFISPPPKVLLEDRQDATNTNGLFMVTFFKNVQYNVLEKYRHILSHIQSEFCFSLKAVF